MYKIITLDPDAPDKFCMEASTFYFITLNFVLGGHRKHQLVEMRWGRVDFDECSIEIIDYKGNTGGQEKRTVESIGVYR